MCMCQAYYNWRDMFSVTFYDISVDMVMMNKPKCVEILNEMKSEPLWNKSKEKIR